MLFRPTPGKRKTRPQSGLPHIVQPTHRLFVRSPGHNDRVKKQLVFVGKSGRECQWIVASDANGQRRNVIHRLQRPEPPNRVILELPKVTDQEVGRRVDLDRQAAASPPLSEAHPEGCGEPQVRAASHGK